MIRNLRSRTLLFSLASLAIASVAARGQQSGVEPPLHTNGHEIVDADGHNVRLTSVNWYGSTRRNMWQAGSITLRWPRS